MRYSLVSGSLPNGLNMAQTDGKVRLHGVTLPDIELFNPPQFSTEEILGYVGEYEDGDFEISIDMPPERTLVGITLVDGCLPWGFEFDGNTVRGVAAELLDRGATYFAPEESPKWNTASGVIATVDESEEVEIPLDYSDGNSISVISGSLPWGLEITANSTIVGTVAELVAPADPYVNTLGPIWQTQAGMIGVYDESDVVEVSVRAHPRIEGENVNIYLVRGYLPYGLELTPSSGSMNGVISGVVDELRGLVTAYGPFNNPRLDTVTLPTMRIGQPIDTLLSATSYNGKSHGFVATGLPWGINLTPSGRLHGSPIEAGIFDVVVTVQDDDYLTTSRTFTINIPTE